MKNFELKKIINGKKYDTTTAKQIGYYDCGLSSSDFYYYREALYLKKTGEYFLAGEGHGNTRYAYSDGNSRGWSKKIFPFALTDAKRWVEANLTSKEYEILFGEVEE